MVISFVWSGSSVYCFAAPLSLLSNPSAQDHLPGLESLDKSIYFVNVTYPRFLAVPVSAQRGAAEADLILELRVGRSGLGDDWLYKYIPSNGWTQIGRYLEVRDYAWSPSIWTITHHQPYRV